MRRLPQRLHFRAVRLLFFGTPEIAVPTLDAISRDHDVVLVVAQPDRPAGRGMKLQRPPVAVRAGELGLDLVQPVKIREEAFLRRIAETGADAAVVIAYGRILPAPLLAIPRHGFFNVHASILPKYRGAAPMQRAIEAGETETGATIMRVDEQLDHGPVLGVTRLRIGPDERLPSVAKRLGDAGAKAMADVLRQIENGTAKEVEQDHALATHAAKIEKSEGLITFAESAKTIYDRFRAFDPWPGVFFESAGETLKVREMRPADGTGKARTILSIGDGVIVATGNGALRLLELQRPGKSAAPAADVARGLGWRAGAPIP